MNELAQQYNLIGETLRRGVEGMLEGKTENKTLELHAKRMGAEIASRERNYSLELKKFQEQQKVNDINARNWDLANKKKVTQDQYRMETWDSPATMHTMGGTSPWMRDTIMEKVNPNLKKLGYEYGEDGVYYKNGKQVSQGELWSDADVVAIFKANTELDDVLPHQIKYERSELQRLQALANVPDEKRGFDQQTLTTMIKAQKNVVEQHEAQLAHKEQYPVKYLNARINGIFQIMQSSPNSDILNKELELMLAERGKLIDQQISKGAFNAKNFKVKTYYAPDGSEMQHKIPWNSPAEEAKVDTIMDGAGYLTSKKAADQIIDPSDKEKLAGQVKDLSKMYENLKAGKGLSTTALAFMDKATFDSIKNDTTQSEEWLLDRIAYYKGMMELPPFLYNEDGSKLDISGKAIYSLSKKSGIPREELYKRIITTAANQGIIAP